MRNIEVDVAVVHFDDTLAYIDRMQRARTPEEVCRILLDVTRQFGLTALLAGTVPNPGTPRDEQRSHVLFCDGPAEWLERCAALNYVDQDLTDMKRNPSTAFRREAAEVAGSDADAPQACGDAGAFKLKDRFTLPLVTLDGEVVMVSMGGEQVELSDHAVRVISLVATFAIGRAMQLSSPRRIIEHRPELTGREKECMRWAALGKSEWEISQILGISEHTSEKHLLNAKTKLGATNRVQAVAEAIRHGYIS